MKKLLFVASMLVALAVDAQSYKDKTWAQLCSGAMDTEWYGSEEAQSVADTLVAVQKTNGGWMKNYQYHKLSPEELARYKSLGGSDGRSAHSCFDNGATTGEMRFLARVYRQTRQKRYLEAWQRALDLIFVSSSSLNGGWPQYWPLSSDKYSYQNYITFNDDLMTNIMKVLKEVSEDSGEFAGFADEATKDRCRQLLEGALQCVMNCQIDDNGVKAAWCAQHDPADFMPAEGRPHEMPSVSCSESAALLSFLMTIDNPSKELQQCITSAVEWLSAHKYMENAAIEDYTNDNGEADRHIVQRSGSNLWGRFVQIGGESGKAIYEKFYNKLKARGKSRSHHLTGYSYKEYQIAEASYDESKAYQPIYGIYSNDYPELFYRYLYSYEDAPDVVDKYGQVVKSSLTAANRRSYQYLGSWCDDVINAYKQWKAKMDMLNEAGDAKIYSISHENQSGNGNTDTTWEFSNGFAVSNQKGKGYASGKNNTVKYSACSYEVSIPEGLAVTKVNFSGYDNYADADAYISEFNGQELDATAYVFPAKSAEGVENYVSHTLALDTPAEGKLTFAIGKKQTCLILSFYCQDLTTGIETVSAITKDRTVKCISGGQLVIRKNGRCYNALGQPVYIK